MSAFRHRNLPLLLLRARESVLALFRPILKRHGLTEQQWRVIRLLLDEQGLEPRQIGQACGFSSPSLAGILARLDDLGYVQRERFEHDQRRVLVRLTPASRDLAARIAPEIEGVYARLQDQLGAPVIDRFYLTLDEIVAEFGALASPADEPPTSR